MMSAGMDGIVWEKKVFSFVFLVTVIPAIRYAFISTSTLWENPWDR